MSGLTKKDKLIQPKLSEELSSSVASWNKASGTSKEHQVPFSLRQRMVSKAIHKPQLKFKDLIDNSSRPFLPILKAKPNAIRPLSDSK